MAAIHNALSPMDEAMKDVAASDELALRPRREDTAHHEAGHAVVAIVQGLSIDSVTIVPGKDSLGSCIHPGPMGYHFNGKRERRAIAKACILGCYAGLEAEKLFNRHADPRLASEDDANAWNVSREYCVLPRACGMIGDDAHDAYLERLRKESRRLVKQHWQKIRVVAQALLTRNTLSGDDVDAIINTGRMP